MIGVIYIYTSQSNSYGRYILFKEYLPNSISRKARWFLWKLNVEFSQKDQNPFAHFIICASAMYEACNSRVQLKPIPSAMKLLSIIHRQKLELTACGDNRVDYENSFLFRGPTLIPFSIAATKMGRKISNQVMNQIMDTMDFIGNKPTFSPVFGQSFGVQMFGSRFFGDKTLLSDFLKVINQEIQQYYTEVNLKQNNPQTYSVDSKFDSPLSSVQELCQEWAKQNRFLWNIYQVQWWLLWTSNVPYKKWGSSSINMNPSGPIGDHPTLRQKVQYFQNIANRILNQSVEDETMNYAWMMESLKTRRKNQSECFRMTWKLTGYDVFFQFKGMSYFSSQPTPFVAVAAEIEKDETLMHAALYDIAIDALIMKYVHQCVAPLILYFGTLSEPSIRTMGDLIGFIRRTEFFHAILFGANQWYHWQPYNELPVHKVVMSARELIFSFLCFLRLLNGSTFESNKSKRDEMNVNLTKGGIKMHEIFKSGTIRGSRHETFLPALGAGKGLSGCSELPGDNVRAQNPKPSKNTNSNAPSNADKDDVHSNEENNDVHSNKGEAYVRENKGRNDVHSNKENEDVQSNKSNDSDDIAISELARQLPEMAKSESQRKVLKIPEQAIDLTMAADSPVSSTASAETSDDVDDANDSRWKPGEGVDDINAQLKAKRNRGKSKSPSPKRKRGKSKSSSSNRKDRKFNRIPKKQIKSFSSSGKSSSKSRGSTPPNCSSRNECGRPDRRRSAPDHDNDPPVKRRKSESSTGWMSRKLGRGNAALGSRSKWTSRDPMMMQWANVVVDNYDCFIACKNNGNKEERDEARDTILAHVDYMKQKNEEETVAFLRKRPAIQNFVSFWEEKNRQMKKKKRRQDPPKPVSFSVEKCDKNPYHSMSEIERRKQQLLLKMTEEIQNERRLLALHSSEVSKDGLGRRNMASRSNAAQALHAEAALDMVLRDMIKLDRQFAHDYVQQSDELRSLYDQIVHMGFKATHVTFCKDMNEIYEAIARKQ